jgi:hypothetical protein
MTKQQTGAQFEISVDGKPRSYRDTKATAMEGAEYLKQRHPHSEVTVKDLRSGEVTVATWKPERPPPTATLRRSQ